MAQSCAKCGKSLPDRSKFCPTCGTPRPTVAAVVGSDVRFAEGGEAAIDLQQSRLVNRTPRAATSVAKPGGQLVVASFGQRLSAFLFDVLILLIVLMASTFLLSAFSGKSVFGSNAMLVAFYATAICLYTGNYIVLARLNGQTIGKRLVGIRIVGEGGAPARLSGLFLRHFVGYFLSAFAAFVGFLWAAWDPRHEAWHDKIARTTVVVS